MLVHLQVRDFAIIESIELELGAGLTALTGETGAGKSILVDAVMLVIGGRASADVVRHGAARAEISATFAVAGNAAVAAWLEAQELQAGEEIVLRRVIGRDGRSRCYINGQTLPAQLLRELGELLIEIHGQQEFLSLLRADAQRQMLDEFGGHGSLQAPVRELATDWRQLRAEHRALQAAAAERGSRLELLRYQVGELEALALADGEVATLMDEQVRLANSGRLAEAARAALQLGYEGDGNDAHALASRAITQLRPAAALDARLEPALRLLADAVIGLKESGSELGAYLESLDVDPARQDWVERRMAAIEDLARKHRVAAAALPDTLRQLGEELAALSSSELTVAGLERRLAEIEARYRTAASALSTARRGAAERLAVEVSALMAVLGMPGGRLQIISHAESGDGPRTDGDDEIEFRVTANPGQPARPLARVASGGELSRISLAVQVAAARGTERGCMIFDEVDAGVGGAVAEMVGRQLGELGQRGQVLCVTHLAQVASQARHQLRVSKLTDGRRSRMTVSELAADERVEELARMLGGIEVTRKAREHAREMLKAAGSAKAG